MPMTPEQRRAKDAERKRVARAKAAAERDAERARRRDASDASAPRRMRDAVERSLAAMKWLQPSDDTAVELARDLAQDVDESRHEGDRVRAQSAARALTRVMHELGGTPTVRMQHELRSLRAQTKSEVPDGSNDEAAQAGNVSQFKRPEKRKRA